MIRIPEHFGDSRHLGSLSNQKSPFSSDSQSSVLWVLALLWSLMCPLELALSPSEPISSAGLNGGPTKALAAMLGTHSGFPGCRFKPRSARLDSGLSGVPGLRLRMPPVLFHGPFSFTTHTPGPWAPDTCVPFCPPTAIYTAPAPTCDGAVAHEQSLQGHKGTRLIFLQLALSVSSHARPPSCLVVTQALFSYVWGLVFFFSLPHFHFSLISACELNVHSKALLRIKRECDQWHPFPESAQVMTASPPRPRVSSLSSYTWCEVYAWIRHPCTQGLGPKGPSWVEQMGPSTQCRNLQPASPSPPPLAGK